MTLTGKAAIYGINGDLVYTGVAAITGDQMMQSGEFTHEFDIQELKNSTGDIVGLASGNERMNGTIDFIPIGGSGGNNTQALARSQIALPPPLTQVVLSAFDANTDGSLDAVNKINGTYVYIGGGRVSYTNDGYTKMTLPIRKYKDTSVTNPVV